MASNSDVSSFTSEDLDLDGVELDGLVEEGNETVGENAEEPGNKKRKFNYGSKTTPASRARQFPANTFEVRGDAMWCCACQKPVDHTQGTTELKFEYHFNLLCFFLHVPCWHS